MKHSRHSILFALAIPLLLPACTALPSGFWPSPLKPPKNQTETADSLPEEAERPQRTLTVEPTPTPPMEFVAPRKTGETVEKVPHRKEVADITLNFDQERLPTVIQLIYGEILKKNYAMDPAVANRPDLVTLRTGPQTPRQVEQTARLLLKSYGVAVLDLGGGVYRIVPDADFKGYAPEIRRGRSLPQVPLPLRPIFQLVELQAVRNVDVTGWLKSMFGTKITVQEDSSRNAVMLSGQADDVAAGIEAVRMLDQPGMKGKHSGRINPVYLGAEEMAKKLTDVMTSEGYGAATTNQINYPVTFIAVPGINAVIAFAASEAILHHAMDWASELDQPSPNRGDNAFFTYQAQNTDAQKLADTLREMLASTSMPTTAQTTGGATAPPPTAGTPSPQANIQTVGLMKKIVVSAATNNLIFRGNTDEYSQILKVLKDLDKPTKAALIEVTVAEVNLSDSLQLGVELSSDMLKSGALTALTGGAGLTVKYINGAQTIDMIKALAVQNRAKILSSPRLMARNGETASIQVGQQVPIVSSQLGTAATQGSVLPGSSANLLTAVQYKDVGVILKVKPIIYSGDRIELEVAQEVSDAVSTTTGVTSSPTINTKKVETRLALKDGSTVMLGGLISDNDSIIESGVPLLKDLPWLGQLFRQNTRRETRQELIVLITPYTVLDDQDAHSITDAFRNQLGSWATDPTPRLPIPPATHSEYDSLLLGPH